MGQLRVTPSYTFAFFNNVFDDAGRESYQPMEVGPFETLDACTESEITLRQAGIGTIQCEEREVGS